MGLASQQAGRERDAEQWSTGGARRRARFFEVQGAVATAAHHAAATLPTLHTQKLPHPHHRREVELGGGSLERRERGGRERAHASVRVRKTRTGIRHDVDMHAVAGEGTDELRKLLHPLR